MITKIGLYRDPRKKRPWVVRWYGEYDPATGKQRRYSKSFRLKAEAEEFQATKRQETGQGAGRDRAPNVALSTFCKDWLITRKAELSPASQDLYVQTIKRLEDFFGKDINLRDITPKRAAVFIAEQKSRAIGHIGKELSDWSREQIKRQRKTIFETAVQWGFLATNPFKCLRLRKPAPKRWYRMPVEEYHALLEAAPTLREKVAYALLYTAGVRMGEAFSLSWDCVDFENGRLMISNHEGTADLPPFKIKDHESRRIPLPEHTVRLLAEWQDAAPENVPYILLTAERLKRIKKRWQKLRREGKPWRNRYMVNNVLRKFKRHCKRAGIKPVGKPTIHTLPKCAGQNWADYLPMNVVKELMGHSNIATTAEFYNQVDADHEEKAARVIQKLIDNAENNKNSNKTDAKMTPEPDSRQIGGTK